MSRCTRWLAFLLLLWAGTGFGAPAAHLDVKQGEPFPDLAFEALLAPGDYARLGLPQTAGPFHISQIPGEVLVLEFFNKSCVPCQRQVRRLQAFYDSLGPSGLAGRVRVLAIAAGNQPKYLPRYRERRQLTYPITADPQFDQWRRLGEPGRTPFTVLVRRDARGWILGSAVFGIQEEGTLEANVRELLAGGLGPAPEDPEEVPPQQYRAPPLSPERQEELAREILSRVAGRSVRVEAIDLPEGNRVYRAAGVGGPALYAKIAHREPVCEVCHAVRFVFVFDEDGRIRCFEPIHVTKYGNEMWTPEDAQFLNDRLDGRKMAGLAFDPEVDAVSRATMSSALIFDEVRRTLSLLQELRRRQ